MCGRSVPWRPRIFERFGDRVKTTSEVRAVWTIVDSRGCGRLVDNPKGSLADIKAQNGRRDVIPECVKDDVSLDQFAA